MNVFSYFRVLLLLLLIVCQNRIVAQSYDDSLLTWQRHYKEAFLETEKSPLTAADTGFIRFYKPDPVWRVQARFVKWDEPGQLLLPTYNRKSKAFTKYGSLDFEIGGRMLRLFVYQNQNYMTTDSLHLFLPFTDLTNGSETYGGGRYIDLSVGEIRDGHIVLDFNKAYNPYCAFAGGYSCPVPPEENRLTIAIPVGERQFAGEVKD